MKSKRLITRKEKIIAVVGLGYVGLPLALLASKKGYKVIGVDIDETKVHLINEGKSPFFDKKIAKGLKSSQLIATSDFSLIPLASLIVICVPSPMKEDRTPDYEPIIKASKKISKNLRKGQLIILESTVNPGVCEEIILPVLENGSGLKAGEDFFLAHCPERINPGDNKWNLSNIPRVVGGLNNTSLIMAIRFYRSVITAKLKPMRSLKEAEAVKIVENSFRNINIAFVNELALSFSMLDIDVLNVIEGAASKPFAFMPHYPGCGVGGHCIPVDPHYLIEYVKKKTGFEHPFLSMACRVNEEMPKYTAKLVVDSLSKRKIRGKKVAVLGLAYKADSDDCRESPSFKIMSHLQAEGAQVVSYDPFVLDKSDKQTLQSAIKGTDTVVIATAHKEFKKLKGKDFLKFGVKSVVDGRNCLDKEDIKSAGINYIGIGR